MSIELIDAQCGFGGANAGDPLTVSAGDLIEEMGRVGIAGALVRRVPDALMEDVSALNEVLYAAHAAHPSLIPCPVVVPGRSGSLPSEQEQVAVHASRGCGAVTIRPRDDHWSLAWWMSDRLFTVLEERQVPVFCLMSRVGLEDVGSIAERFPGLPIIVAGVEYMQHRVLLSLLEAFPRVHLSVGTNYTVHYGIEELVAKTGPDRLLFGTGYPQVEPMAAVTQLMYSDIGEDERRLIGAGNMRRLIAEVRR
ncbi:MAG: amidohydrolase family protein [Gemmatimonadales bacterium]|nr:amidohydrolase family protein [Gemmatimonadales bacterium]